MNETYLNEIVYEESVEDSGVLIVDDDLDCLRMLRLHFKMAGFQTSCALSGNEALSLLRTGQFTLMITDYNMPGMNGLMLSKKAKTIVPELSIIMVTGEHLAQITSNALELGIIAVLPKPIDINKLFGKVRTEKTRRRLEQE